MRCLEKRESVYMGEDKLIPKFWVWNDMVIIQRVMDKKGEMSNNMSEMHQ